MRWSTLLGRSERTIFPRTIKVCRSCCHWSKGESTVDGIKPPLVTASHNGSSTRSTATGGGAGGGASLCSSLAPASAPQRPRSKTAWLTAQRIPPCSYPNTRLIPRAAIVAYHTIKSPTNLMGSLSPLSGVGQRRQDRSPISIRHTNINSGIGRRKTTFRYWIDSAYQRKSTQQGPSHSEGFYVSESVHSVVHGSFRRDGRSGFRRRCIRERARRYFRRQHPKKDASTHDVSNPHRSTAVATSAAQSCVGVCGWSIGRVSDPSPRAAILCFACTTACGAAYDRLGRLLSIRLVPSWLYMPQRHLSAVGTSIRLCDCTAWGGRSPGNRPTRHGSPWTTSQRNPWHLLMWMRTIRMKSLPVRCTGPRSCPYGGPFAKQCLARPQRQRSIIVPANKEITTTTTTPVKRRSDARSVQWMQFH